MKDRTRREFLKDGLAVTAGVVASGVLGNTGTVSARSAGGGKTSSPLETTKKKRRNIVLIITDQQRQAQH